MLVLHLQLLVYLSNIFFLQIHHLSLDLRLADHLPVSVEDVLLDTGVFFDFFCFVVDYESLVVESAQELAFLVDQLEFLVELSNHLSAIVEEVVAVFELANQLSFQIRYYEVFIGDSKNGPWQHFDWQALRFSQGGFILLLLFLL